MTGVIEILIVRKLAGVGTLATARGTFDSIRYLLTLADAPGETLDSAEGTIWRRGTWLDAAFDASGRGKLILEGGETIEIEVISITGETGKVRVLPP